MWCDALDHLHAWCGTLDHLRLWRDKFNHVHVWHDKFDDLHVWRDTFDLIYTCHIGLFTRVTWHIHTLDEPYLYLLHASFLCDIFMPRLRAKVICATYQKWVGTRLNSVCHDSLFISASCLVFTCSTAYLYAWHDSCTRVAWLIDACDVALSCVSYDSSMRVTWLIHVWDMNHSHVCYDGFKCVILLLHKTP